MKCRRVINKYRTGFTVDHKSSTDQNTVTTNKAKSLDVKTFTDNNTHF